MKIDQQLCSRIMQTIAMSMARNHYCCGCYAEEYFIVCHIVKDDYYRMTRYLNIAWITKDTKWVDILAEISHFVDDVNRAFMIYQKEHFTENTNEKY